MYPTTLKIYLRKQEAIDATTQEEESLHLAYGYVDPCDLSMDQPSQMLHFLQLFYSFDADN